MPVTLRTYQLDTLLAIEKAFERGYHAPLNILFTGAGKTEIFIEYVRRYVDISKQRVFINTPAHLTFQTYLRFLSRHPDWSGSQRIAAIHQVKQLGVVLADNDENNARIITGSTDTVIDRVPYVTDLVPILAEDIERTQYGGVKLSAQSARTVLVSERFDRILVYGVPDIMINDEAHHSVAPATMILHERLKQIRAILDLPQLKVIGFTATGMREDGVGLENLYDCITTQKPVTWGIENGYLSELLDPIQINGSVDGTLHPALDMENWIDLVVEGWLDNGKGRPTLGYFQSLTDSIEVTRAMQKAGIKAAHVDGACCIDVDGTTHSKDFREDIIARFLTGDVEAINNFGVFIEGTDLPPASCMIWARPTDNTVVFTQALGRILRLFSGSQHLPEKENALVLDATGGDLFLLTIGTLSGISAQVDVVYEDKELDVTEREATGGVLKDIKDAISADHAEYTVGRIIQKSGSDWHHASDGILVLTVSTTDTLVIVPPHYTLATHLDYLIRETPQELTIQLEGNTLGMFVKARDLFSNYTLWHVKKDVSVTDWVFEDPSLAMVMDFAIPYAYERATNGQVVTSFVKRSRRGWKSKATPMSDGQIRYLTDLIGYDNINPQWSRIEANHRIAYETGFKQNVARRLVKYYREIEKHL